MSDVLNGTVDFGGNADGDDEVDAEILKIASGVADTSALARDNETGQPAATGEASSSSGGAPPDTPIIAAGTTAAATTAAGTTTAATTTVTAPKAKAKAGATRKWNRMESVTKELGLWAVFIELLEKDRDTAQDAIKHAEDTVQAD